MMNDDGQRYGESGGENSGIPSIATFSPIKQTGKEGCFSDGLYWPRRGLKLNRIALIKEKENIEEDAYFASDLFFLLCFFRGDGGGFPGAIDQGKPARLLMFSRENDEFANRDKGAIRQGDFSLCVGVEQWGVSRVERTRPRRGGAQYDIIGIAFEVAGYAERIEVAGLPVDLWLGPFGKFWIGARSVDGGEPFFLRRGMQCLPEEA